MQGTQPTSAGRSLHEVGMTCTCNRVYAVRIKVALSKYRILLGRNEWSKRAVASENHL